MTHFKLRTKFFIQNLLLISLLTSLIIVSLLTIQQEMLYNDSTERIHIIKEIISKTATPSLEFEDKESLDDMFKSLIAIKNINFIVLFDKDKNHFSSLNMAAYTKFIDQHNNIITKNIKNKQIELEDEIISYSEIISGSDEDGFHLFGYIFISYSKNQMNEMIQKSLIISMLLFFVALIFAAFSSYSLTKMIVFPINKLKTFFTQMADGEGDLTIRLNVTTQDEFKDLATEFNRFLDRLKDLIGNIQQVSKTVDLKVQDVENLSYQNDKFIAELSGLLDQIMDNTRSLDNGARINVTSAEKATEQSEKTISISLTGQKSLTHSINEMAVIKTEINELEQGMLLLNKHSKNIQVISNTLNDIADKTSILAINTSIEANKAGDAGFGFLVIAEEIQNLSEQSAIALKNIHEITRNIQSSLEASNNLTNSCVKRIIDGTLNIENTGEQISSSVESVQTNMVFIEEVLDMAKKQREQVKKIYEFIVTSSKNVSTIRRSANNTVTNVKEQRELIESLSGTIKDIKV